MKPYSFLGATAMVDSKRKMPQIAMVGHSNEELEEG
jgi:hypothetical protein